MSAIVAFLAGVAAMPLIRLACEVAQAVRTGNSPSIDGWYGDE